MRDLSVVIVSWNVRDLLRDCLQSVVEDIQNLDGEIIVVDAASTDGTVEMVAQDFPNIQLITPGENVGFSKGNNIGLRASQGRHVLVLNPDTVILGDALKQMVEFLDQHSEVGVVGPQLLNDDGTVQSSRRRFPTVMTGIFESTWLEAIAPKRLLDGYYIRDRSDTEMQQVDWVQGAACTVRREVIEEVGLMDEAFFMYSEEMDWQKRINEAGWKVFYHPEAQIVHLGGKSSEQVVAQRHIYFQTSKVRYFQKHHGQMAGALIRAVVLMNYVWQLILEAAKGLVGHKRELRKERIRAYWQVLRTGLKVA